MIITVSGLPACGKSTVAKKLANHYELDHKSTGDIFRRIAKERNMNVRELNESLEDDPAIDFEIDEKTKLLGELQDDFVMDSRLAFYFIPHSFKILLKVSVKEAVRRLKEDDTRSIENDVRIEMKKRVQSEKKRYKKLYGIDYEDESNFDLVINTDEYDVKQIMRMVTATVDEQVLKS